MLKLCFWILLAANVVLFVFQQTYFDAPTRGKREPERLSLQYRADDIRVLSADEVSRALAQARAVGQVVPEADKASRPESPQPAVTAAQTPQAGTIAAPVASQPDAASAQPAPEPDRKAAAQQPATAVAPAAACVEIGQFGKDEAADFERRLRPLALKPEDISMNTLQESRTSMVLIPPSPSRKAAEEKIAGLKAKGVTSYYLIKEPQLRWGISLGVFGAREAALNYAAMLEKSGLAGLQVVPRGEMVEKRAYRLNNLNGEQLKALEAIMGRFSGQTMRHCPLIPQNPA
ncbi:MAG: hypothetical protein LBM56_04370 [Burkholderiaceae bacterium]|jgi:hypothetical protein|nr:hypothetical protein [Burkholderiaceae bacterium]